MAQRRIALVPGDDRRLRPRVGQANRQDQPSVGLGLLIWPNIIAYHLAGVEGAQELLEANGHKNENEHCPDHQSDQELWCCTKRTGQEFVDGVPEDGESDRSNQKEKWHTGFQE